MERKMTQPCELTQIGRVGAVKEVGQNLMISVASDASYKKDGEWVNRANWIEHTVFGRRGGLRDRGSGRRKMSPTYATCGPTCRSQAFRAR